MDIKITPNQLRRLLIKNGPIEGRIIEKILLEKPDHQLFALLVANKEVRHFMVDLLGRTIYEGSLYKDSVGELIFGYLNFPPIKYEENDLQMWQNGTSGKDKVRI